MPTDALVLSFDNFDLAQLVQTGFDMVQNNHAHNITDFAFKEESGGRWIHDTDETGGFQGAVRFNAANVQADRNTFNYLLGGPFSASDQVLVSFMAKAASARSVGVALKRSADNFRIDNETTCHTVDLTSEWQRFVKIFTLEEVANSIHLMFDAAFPWGLNVASNSNFEAWASGAAAPPDSWTMNGPPGTIERVTDCVDGSYAAKMTLSAGWYVVEQLQSQPKMVGKSAAAGAWVKGSHTNGKLIIITNADSKTKSPGSAGSWRWIYTAALDLSGATWVKVSAGPWTTAASWMIVDQLLVLPGGDAALLASAPSLPSTADMWIADVHAWKILDTESLPKCDTITFAPSQGISSRQNMDEEYKLTRRTTAPRTAITISDPYANSNPAFWLNKLGDPGRRWQYGIHVDGDMGEGASSWTAQDSASAEFTAESPLIGADVLEVTDPGSGANPRAAYITGRTGDASRNMVATAWLWHDSATGVVDSAPMIMSDGLSAHGVDDPHSMGYTLTDIPTLLRTAFIVDTAPSKLTHNLQAPDTSTNKYRFDGVKLERSQYSPIVQCQPAYLWGLWVRFDDGTNYHYMFVPAVRWMKSQIPVRMGKYLIDSINGSGGELLRWKVAK